MRPKGGIASEIVSGELVCVAFADIVTCVLSVTVAVASAAIPAPMTYIVVPLGRAAVVKPEITALPLTVVPV